MFWLKRHLNRLRNAGGRKLNIAMFHSGRCGSTVLGDLLNQHPQIRWADEIFERPHYKETLARGMAPLELVEFDMYKTRVPYYGFETKALKELHLRPGFLDLSIGQYLGELERLGFSKFITLKRKNYLRRVVSAVGLREKGITHSREQRQATERMHLDPEKVPLGVLYMPLFEYFRKLDAYYAELETELKNRSSLALTYEDDLLRDPLAGYHRVCAFLGVEPAQAEVKLVRTNPGPIAELVDNYDQIESVLKNTEYEWMLHAD